MNTVSLSELAANNGQIARVRLLTGFVPRHGYGHVYEVSYIHGVIDGETVNVAYDGVGTFPRNTVGRVLLNWALENNVYGKGIGLFDRSLWSIY